MFGWIAERYKGDKDKLYSSYNTTYFNRSKEREILWALPIILGLKTKIKVDEAIVTMTYNIIEAHICYEFIIFFSKEIKKNLINTKQGD